MKNKKLRGIVLALGITVIGSVFVGCGSTTEDNSSKNENKQEEKFTMEYTETMQKMGFKDPLVLDKEPQKIVSMSTGITPVLFEMDAELIAIPNSKMFEAPSDYTGEKLQLVMNKDFDIETVVAMSPDLVIVSASQKDTYGKFLEESAIPVYYVNSGHTVSYESIKQETEVVINAFDEESEKGKEIMKSFDDLEARMEENKKLLEGKTTMVLQSAPPTHYIQSNKGSLGSMAEMIGLTNVYENQESGMVPMDLETSLGYTPDLILTVGGSPLAEDHQKLMEEDFKGNEKYWSSYEAIENGNIIYLPSTFVSSAGIKIIDNINTLMDLVTENLGLNN